MKNGDFDLVRNRGLNPARSGSTYSDATFDTRVDALAAERRRRTVRRAMNAAGPVTFDELVEHLLSSGGEPTSRSADPDDIALRLYHVDLPKLADAGLVDFDRETKLVEATEAAGELGPLLDELDT